MSEQVKPSRLEKELYWSAAIVIVTAIIVFVVNSASRELEQKSAKLHARFASEQFDGCILSSKRRNNVEFCTCYSDRVTAYFTDYAGDPDQFQASLEAEGVKSLQVCDAIVPG